MRDFLAGFLITLGAFAYLTVGGPLGALLFSFGIICIVKLQVGLYTGVAGTDIKFINKIEVLGKNVFGAIVASFILGFIASDTVFSTAQTMALNKITAPWYVSLFKAVMCGVIVDISVFLSKKDNSVIPLLIGIPLFILCGFNHSIADVSYLLLGATPETIRPAGMIYYLICVIGNYFGCNLRRFCMEGIIKDNSKN